MDWTEMAQRESRLSREIMKALRDKYGKQIYVWKIHGGPLMPAGLPDIVGVYRGRFFAFETKMPEGKGPSTIQLHVHERLRTAGARVDVPRSVADALNTFTRWFPPGLDAGTHTDALSAGIRHARSPRQDPHPKAGA